MNRAEYNKLQEDLVLAARSLFAQKKAIQKQIEVLVEQKYHALQTFLGCPNCKYANRPELYKGPCCLKDDIPHEGKNLTDDNSSFFNEETPGCKAYEQGEPQEYASPMDFIRKLFERKEDDEDTSN